MNTTKYEVTNKKTNETTTFEIPSRFDKAKPDNIILKIEQNDIDGKTFIVPEDQREENITLTKKLTPSIESYGQLVPGTVLKDGTED